MRMNVHNEARQRVATLEVDPAEPPPVVHGVARGSQRREEHYLDWDRAFDDEGHLRKCPACNCPDLFRARTVPALTGFIVVLAVGLVCLALWGLTDAPLGWMLALLGVVIAANVTIVLKAPRYLQCYRCGSSFRGVPMSRSHTEWDQATAERYQAETPPPRPRQAEAAGDDEAAV